MRTLACLAVLLCTAAAAPAQQAAERIFVLTAGTRFAVLDCGQVHTSTHPKAAEACSALDRVAGDPSLLTPKPGVMCTMEYDPVTATATGVWDGRLVRFTHTYGNACALRVESGALFAF